MVFKCIKRTTITDSPFAVGVSFTGKCEGLHRLYVICCVPVSCGAAFYPTKRKIPVAGTVTKIILSLSLMLS